MIPIPIPIPISTRTVLSLALALGVAIPAAADQAAAAVEALEAAEGTYEGRIVDFGHTVEGVTAARFELHVDESIGDEELARLARIERTQGQEALRRALEERTAGYVRIDQNLGYPISFARSFPTDDGRVVYAVLDRPLQFYEVMDSVRSESYPFSVVELRLDRDGTGEGTLHAVARVSLSEAAVRVDGLERQPYRLVGIEREE